MPKQLHLDRRQTYRPRPNLCAVKYRKLSRNVYSCSAIGFVCVIVGFSQRSGLTRMALGCVDLDVVVDVDASEPITLQLNELIRLQRKS